jgi:D-alanyl-D-alanine dipeptidase
MLLDLASPHFDLDFEIAYGTSENFTGKQIYKRPRALLRPEAAEKLQAAIILAARLNLRFKIFDAFRPSEAQWALWRAAPNSGYVAAPEAQRNRHLLLGLMTAAGWDCYRKEWWHYQLFHPRSYPSLTDAQADSNMM